MTGFRVQALTASIVYEITKGDIEPIPKVRPTIVAELGQIMVKREAAWKNRLSRLDEIDTQPANMAARLAERIKELFGLPT